MPRVITDEDLDELELSRRPTWSSHDEWIRERVATLVEWADSEDVSLQGVTRSHLLSVAAEHLSSLDDHEGAVALARRATEADDEDALDAIPALVAVLLERGDVDEAADAASRLREVLREDPYATHPSTFERIGEDFAFHGELAQAERWFTLGVRNAELTDASEIAYARLITFRAAVRRRAGKTADVMDGEAQRIAGELGWSDSDPLLYKDDQ